MKKLLILLSILIFIICDKKFNEKFDNIRIEQKYICNRRVICPEGYIQIKCGCKKLCKNGYISEGKCIKHPDLYKCSKGFYYSRYYAKCCPLKGRTCRPIKKPNKTKKIDN